ncbi:MAG TPA: fumarylacetoacetate hydrolase family protein [Acidimicrobiales bacterium]|nr:fumarylacetoacetate hydrolase family protein [Acidimicrobiales bacterium]
MSFDDGGGVRPGCLMADGRVLDVGGMALAAGVQPPGHVGEVLQALSSGQHPLADELRGVLDGGVPVAAAPVVPAGRFRLRAPFTPGAQIVCAGANYRSHLEEMQGLHIPSSVLWFTKAPTAVIGHGDPIVLPREAPGQVDYEGELAVVIGRHCYRAGEEEALSCVGGYTLLNDVSARDWVAAALAAEDPEEVRAAWGRNLLGKQFPTFCPVGPAIVTSDEVADPGQLHLITRVNGSVVQDAWTSDLIVDVARLVSYLSGFIAFVPGDIISTGSPAGVGVARTPPVFLAAGDRVEVEIESIGVLANPVEAELP